MLDAAQNVLAGEEAWVVGGAVRDELLGRELVDLDIACRAPDRAARAYARRSGGAPFPLSERHGAWRVALADGRTVDFTPLAEAIEDDLATRDFTINAIARPLAGGEAIDPFGGLRDLDEQLLRAVGERVFVDDPLRLLRAVRLEDELGFRLDDETERLVREHAALATNPAGERVVGELRRLSADGYRRLDDLGLLEPLGGRIDDRLDRVDSPEYRLVAVFRDGMRRLRRAMSSRPPLGSTISPPASGRASAFTVKSRVARSASIVPRSGVKSTVRPSASTTRHAPCCSESGNGAPPTRRA